MDRTSIGQPYRRHWRRRILIVGGVVVAIWLLFNAHWPKYQRGRAIISPPGMEPVVISLWSAEPLIKIPFFDGKPMWIRCGKHERMLHNGGFGYNVGRVAVSPDFKEAVIYHSFEGGQFPSIFVDLNTGKLRDVQSNHYFTTYEDQGWLPCKWE